MCKTKKELNELVAKYQKLTTEKKKIEDKLDAVKADIEEYVRDKGQKGGKNGATLIVFGDDYKVSLVPIPNLRWDDDKLKAFFGDNYNQYKTPHPYDRLDIR